MLAWSCLSRQGSWNSSLSVSVNQSSLFSLVRVSLDFAVPVSLSCRSHRDRAVLWGEAPTKSLVLHNKHPFVCGTVGLLADSHTFWFLDPLCAVFNNSTVFERGGS